MNSTELFSNITTNATLQDILCAINSLQPSSLDKLITYLGSFFTFCAFLFSMWLYLNDKFKEKFNFLINHISNLQQQIYEGYFFNQLDSIYQNGQIDFNQANFSESRIYSSLIKFIFELLNLVDKSKIDKKYVITLIKVTLTNETVWIGSIYCLQNQNVYGVPNQKFKKLWQKYQMMQGIALFDSRYGVDEMSEMNSDQINCIDERIFAYREKYNKILTKLREQLIQ